MDPDRWQKLEEIFFAALQAAPEQRFAQLDRACGGDAALRAEVEAMLAVHTTGTDAGADREDRGGLADVSAGEVRIGAYRIVELIGRGGMGEVYRAQRADDEYQQDVALKLVRSGHDPTALTTSSSATLGIFRWTSSEKPTRPRRSGCWRTGPSSSGDIRRAVGCGRGGIAMVLP